MSKAHKALNTEVTIWQDDSYEIKVRCLTDGSYSIEQGEDPDPIYLPDDKAAENLIRALRELIDQ